MNDTKRAVLEPRDLTMAERVARMMNANPQWLSELKHHNLDLGEVCGMLDAKHTSSSQHEISEDIDRHEFPDGSAIMIELDRDDWDIGFTAELCEEPGLQDAILINWIKPLDEENSFATTAPPPDFVMPKWFRVSSFFRLGTKLPTHPIDIEGWYQNLETGCHEIDLGEDPTLGFKLDEDQAKRLILEMVFMKENPFLQPDEIRADANERIMNHVWSFYPFLENSLDLLTANQKSEIRRILVKDSFQL